MSHLTKVFVFGFFVFRFTAWFSQRLYIYIYICLILSRMLNTSLTIVRCHSHHMPIQIYMEERPSRWPVFQGWSNGVINLDFFPLSLSLHRLLCVAAPFIAIAVATSFTIQTATFVLRSSFKHSNDFFFAKVCVLFFFAILFVPLNAVGIFIWNRNQWKKKMECHD